MRVSIPRCLAAALFLILAALPSAQVRAQAFGLRTGDAYACALQPGGAVLCWGDGGSGRRGDGTTTAAMTPVPVSAVGGVGDLTGATSLGPGSTHGCAVLSSGSVVCWGSQGRGQLGNGTISATPSLTPVNVTSLTDAADVSSGSIHSCALRTGGTVVCWGGNLYGTLGNGDSSPTTNTADRSTPQTVQQVGGGAGTSLQNVTSVTTGPAGSHSCALLTGGTVACWGSNSAGQLGNGQTITTTATPQQHTPVLVSGLTDAVQVSAGTSHTCAVRQGGTVMCWGSGASGRLGNGAVTSSSVPVAVSGLTDAVQVEASTNNTCALRSTGGVMCWGSDSSGQLGDGGTNTTSFVPVTVVGVGGTGTLGDIARIDLGFNYACAQRINGSTVCWGNGGSGRLGNGTTTSSPTPVSVDGGSSLPVELTSFTAAVDGAAARLTWTTASETGNAGFSVETLRSDTWQEVTFVAGRGTTSEAHTYTRTVAGLAPGRHAFRLRQVDLDGTATLSGTVEVVITPGGGLSIYPSPARTSVRIEGLTEVADVVDVLGRVVARAMPGEALSVSSWAPGVYVVMATEPQRFVVAR